MPNHHAFSPPDVRATALHILRIWKPEGVFAEDLVERETSRAGLSGRDRAMVQALVFAEGHVIGELGSRTVREAIAAGIPFKTIWLAVWQTLELPASER